MSKINQRQWRNLLAKARRGDPSSQWEVGRYYDEGTVNGSGNFEVRRQPMRALHWYTLSAKQGNQSAQLALGVLLSSGEGVERDMEAAIHWTKSALKQGSSAAAHNLGTIYRDLKKPTEAFRWYKQAVEMGDFDSLFQLGLCYFFGFGAEQDFSAAYTCFHKIVDGDSYSRCERTKEDSQYWMGVFHLLGIGGVKKSVAKARGLLESANKDCDHEQANEILHIIGKTKYMKV